MKLINSGGNPIRVGNTIVRFGVPTTVSKEELDAFLKFDSGKSLFGQFLKIEKPFVESKEPEPDSGDDKADKKVDKEPSKPFLFDPKKHKVSHRGAGKWFVMEGDEKIKGPLTPEQKITYQIMESNDDS